MKQDEKQGGPNYVKDIVLDPMGISDRDRQRRVENLAGVVRLYDELPADTDEHRSRRLAYLRKVGERE